MSEPSVDFWNSLVKKNPGLEAGKTTFNPAQLRKFFDQVWTAAHDQGVRNGKALEQMARKNDSLFGKIFG